MNPEEYYPIPPTKIQKAIICTPEEVQMWKDENLKLKTRITALEAQVAGLREIAGEERVRLIARCVHDCPEGGCLVDEERISETVESIGEDLKEQARRQLSEEHPEAFR